MVVEAMVGRTKHDVRSYLHCLLDRGLGMLVVDEAQHDAASSMAYLHNRIQPRFILGLSATPFRADRVKLCFDTVLKDAGIARLIQGGYLSPFHHYTLPAYSPAAVAA